MTAAGYIFGYLCDATVLTSLVVALCTYYVATFYYRVSRLPPGPFPLPLIGNILDLRKEGYLYEKAVKWSKTYGDPCTVWVGPRPIIITSTKESFKDVSGPLRNQLGGRMKFNLGDLQSRGFVDVIFSDFNPAWDVLRRVVHVAIRKYAQTEKLADLCANHVDKVAAEILDEKEENTYGLVEYVEDIVNNVLGQSAFGGGFTKGDPRYEKLREATIAFETDLANGLPSDIMPILGLVFWRMERRGRRAIRDFFAVTDTMYQKAADTYIPGSSRHFTDALLAARDQFLKEDKSSSKYLTHDNLRQAIFDIFGAGTGTSKSILAFCMLRLAKNKKLQSQLREEIRENIGERHALSGDRIKLPQVNSFIEEIIRYYPAAPLSLPRRALCDVVVNGRSIPKDTGMMINLYAVNRDKETWGEDADEFKADRFLSASKDQISKGATSFGIGSRSCPGEKMAQADIFYCLVRTLQKIELSAAGKDVDLRCINSDLLMDTRRQPLIFKRV